MTERTRRPTILILVALVALIGAWVWQQSAAPRISHQTIRQPAERAARAEVTITAGSGQLQIGALGQSDNLIAGEVAYDARNRLEQRFSLQGDIATFSLRERDDSRPLMLVRGGDEQARWQLQLNRALPMRLAIAAGVGESSLDMSELQVTDLQLLTGVGNTSLTLPRQGQVLVNVSSGVGNLTIRIPRGVAARIDAGGGLGDVRVLGDYIREGDVYVSPDFATATNRVDLRASKGLGAITVMPAAE